VGSVVNSCTSSINPDSKIASGKSEQALAEKASLSTDRPSTLATPLPDIKQLSLETQNAILKGRKHLLSKLNVPMRIQDDAGDASGCGQQIDAIRYQYNLGMGSIYVEMDAHNQYGNNWGQGFFEVTNLSGQYIASGGLGWDTRYQCFRGPNSYPNFYFPHGTPMYLHVYYHDGWCSIGGVDQVYYIVL